jgi:hypothetical protein
LSFELLVNQGKSKVWGAQILRPAVPRIGPSLIFHHSKED